MDFIPFANCFPDVADSESKLIEVPHVSGDLSAGMYVLQEWYCLDNTCDCRKVIINISPVSLPDKILASIGYGWESREFYKAWAYGDDGIADMMVGTHLEFGGRQSDHSKYFLDRCNMLIRKDKDFTESVRKHYAGFKAMVKKLGRNDPCPCGCGRKYKRHGIV